MHPIVRGLGAVLDGGLTRVPARPSLAVVGWHEVAKTAAFLATPFDDFRRHLDAVEATGHPVLPFDTALARLRDGTLDSPAVVLTFDDGYAGVAELAWPEL